MQPSLFGNDGHAAAAAALDHAGGDWADRALSLLGAFALTHAEFKIEDVRRHADAVGLPAPPDGRAWGGVANRARAAGLIVAIGIKLTTYTGNAHFKTHWKSTVFGLGATFSAS